ncbi:glycosyltransferase family 2 protein [Natronincola ferrireducens]|uniref:Dolichol-phosphate mannosyltransferase n=1 Tax=Natronincola ferrireducens TaxID=393762 RepID=A0A1G8X3A0_9FIRM|nr:glycosyltransferase family 2 protein [Natronincola ferrireducens]SDJ84786.1 dolichol-phosphate mannosyltransferase [Natronincola ferrireducens]
MKKLSIVIPVYYNELNIPSLYEKLREAILNKKLFHVELVFVDDGSKDNSYQELIKLREMDKRIKVVKLSKNFGSHTAILAGLSYATGDCATVISADLQDPPEIIVSMYEKWLEGNKVVLAVREDREEGWLQKKLSNTYYRWMKKYALSNMPEGGFDCFLIDKQVIEILRGMKEKNSTLMGQILWCGLKTEKIYYVRREREIGKSKWTLSKKIKLFIDSFLAFSYVPIRFISTFGFIISFLGFLMALIIVINKFINDIPVQGWTSLMVVVLILSGIQLITLGVLGEYLWRNFDETRKRPLFIVEETIGVGEEKVAEERMDLWEVGK